MPTLAVGQHDDAELRRRALAAGADRVHTYRQLFEDGPRQMARWLAVEDRRSRHARRDGVATMITSRPSIPAERYGERISAAQARAAEAGLGAVLVGVGADLRYLTGYPAMPLERLTMLVIPATGTPSLVAPRLEATPARACPPAAAGYLPVVAWEEADDAHALVASMVRGTLEGPHRTSPPRGGLRRSPGASPAAPARSPRRGRARARLAGPARAPDRQGRRRDRAPDRSRPCGGPGRRPDRRRLADRTDRGRCRPGGP